MSREENIRLVEAYLDGLLRRDTERNVFCGERNI